MTTSNDRLREYVTSVGFHLTLSKSMIRYLVREDLIREHGYCVKGFQPRPRSQADPDNFIGTGRALEARGLIIVTPMKGSIANDPTLRRLAKKFQVDSYHVQHPKLHVITKAGRLVIQLLKEAGLYEEFAKSIRPLEEVA